MVYKRDGQIQEFRPEKIENAVLKAFYDVEKKKQNMQNQELKKLQKISVRLIKIWKLRKYRIL